ncbi:hypothetical protein DV737_g2977, partial [Chaetothyriales sp. CBS 132003]
MDEYDERPPPDATGDDGPEDGEDALDETHDNFQDRQSADNAVADDNDSDDESLLSEVDEAQFADFDPSAVQVAPDFESLKAIKAKRRERAPGEESKKNKGRTREKMKQNRHRRDSDDGFELGGDEVEGKRRRRLKPGEGGEGGERRKAAKVQIDEAELTPEERRKRALDRAMDAAVKKGSGIKRRVKGGDIDLEAMADQEIEDMRQRMVNAAAADNNSVMDGKPAAEKLKMLPEVVALLNRNNWTQAILDPEINLLESVRFFLEPLQDGSLPAYNIQRELFAALAKLPMTKEALISSGIGKVILFYRKSKRPEPAIKRQATKLMEEWSRPLLQRSDDFTKKQFQTATYDPARMSSQLAAAAAAAAASSAATHPALHRKGASTLAPGERERTRVGTTGIATESVVYSTAKQRRRPGLATEQ